MNRLGRALFRLAAAGLLIALTWPIAYAVWLSFTPGELLEPPVGEWSLRWYRLFFASPQWTDALETSFIVAGLATALSIVSGVGVAVSVARHHFRGRRVLAVATLTPLFLPAVVLGMALLPLARALGIWGTSFSIAAAHALWGMPLVFLVSRAALEEVDRDLELAARGLGASPAQTFMRVTLPVIAPSVVVGALMAFIVSLNELVMALFLGTPGDETLPKVIWPNLRYTLTPLVAAASGVSTLLTLVVFAGVVALMRTERIVRRVFG
jgi:ABC-type spermidine/putrescine transport system permease subunit II